MTGHLAELIGVGRVYRGPPPLEALKGINLGIAQDEFLAIMGPSGSGKSTLLNVLGLLDRPTSGTFLLGGVDIASLSDEEVSRARATRIGFVFQAFHLLAERSVLQNVELPLLYRSHSRSERRRSAQAALASVGLAGRDDQSARTLSGGERQRVALARALAGKPDFLLCDEPTGNLDSTNSRMVLALLSGIQSTGVAVVVVTHDQAVANCSDRIVHLVDGTFLDGAPRVSAP